jgi:transcriptional regulator
MIELLETRPLDGKDLSRMLSIKEKDVYAHLSHIQKSVKAKGGKLVIRPSECLHCGFVFKDRRRLTPPGRCPHCRQTHLSSPAYQLEPK